jgi:GT2 family glycosyltransferase
MVNTGIDISIVIVNYNVRDFLKSCLISIEAAKQGMNIETIVVDNHSRDNSVEYLQPQFPDVKFIALPENIGFSRANNLAIKQSKGKYTLILNPDTILNEDTLFKMREYMDRHPEVWIAGCKVLNSDMSFQVACRRGFPTPFVSFTKLYGLQALFPKSKLFGRYNQTYRSIDETYYVDAIMGTFMFCRTDKLQYLGGFDEDFFMYGEDLDLCYRVYKAGGKIAYYHETAIIHYKGESTRRSSINAIKHFYEAMIIFVQKHYAKSKIFVLFLKLGILLRQFIAYLMKYSKEFPFILADLVIVIFSLLVSTKIRFGCVFGFPDYAYPIVFIVVGLVYLLSLFSVGEYFEGEHSIRKVLYGSMISFFILSALTYFFKSFAFSRGVVLMTISFSLILSSLFRLLIVFFKNLSKKSQIRRIALIGNNSITKYFYNELNKYKNGKIELVGSILTTDDYPDDNDIPIIGNLEFLANNLDEFGINELIVCERNENIDNLILSVQKQSRKNIKLHYAETIDEFIASDIINKISDSSPLQQYKLLLPRYRLAKRLTDIFLSFFALTLFLPITFVKSRNDKELFKKLFKVFIGRYSIVGIHLQNYIRNFNAKPGILNLANFLPKEQTSEDIIRKLNDYYEQNYSLSLDFDIFLKSIISY